MAKKTNRNKSKKGQKKKKVAPVKADNPNHKEDFDWLLGEMAKPLASK